MGMLDMNDAQQQRYQKAYDIAKRILYDLKVYPANDEEKQHMYDLDELETGYPRMLVQHVYDVVKACAELAGGEKKVDDLASPDYYFQAPLFRPNQDNGPAAFQKESN